MDKIQRFKRVLKCVRLINGRGSTSSLKFHSTVKNTEENTTVTEEPVPSQKQSKLGGFAKSYEKFSDIEKLQESEKETPATFASLLRHSSFMDLGDPEGKYVYGKVTYVVEDDLYIDFGWKFHCVCPRPKVDPTLYVKGTKVILKINSLELSTRFLGAEKDLTLLEADCTLISLKSSPLSKSERPM